MASGVEAGVDPNIEPHIKKQGVIAIILRPSENNNGTYSYYLLDHNHYSQTESGIPKTVHAGIGLMSETMKEGETSDDYLRVLARGYVEEIMGQSPEGVGEDVFSGLVEEARANMESKLTEIGTFTHDFNYDNPDKYHTDPNTRGFVHVFVDDDRVMDVGDINQEEVVYAGYLGNADLDHKYIHFRSGYDTRLLLGSPELQDILYQNNISIDA